MNGAELLLTTAVDHGVDVCFANPGTTEMEFVSALDTVAGMRGVLALFEGVVTGAADGYGRVLGRPALTLVHLGPGFANGIANLHNAGRAHTPVVNLIGDHATWHLDADAPLTSDIESLARPVSRHVVRLASATHGGAVMTEAIAAAMGPPSGVASIIVPQDAAWGAADLHDVGAPPEPVDPVDHDAVGVAAVRLRGGDGAAILLGGTVRRAELLAANRIAEATGAKVFLDTFPAVLEQGRGLPSFDAVPYFPEQALDALAGVHTLICAGTRPPVAFFGYRSVGRSWLLDDVCETLTLTGPGARGHLGLELLVDALECPPADVPHDRPELVVPSGDLDMFTMGATVAALQPDGAIVVNESATSGLGWAMAAAAAPPHEALALTGGAIGQGLPVAVGAAIAAPDRKVIALQADGSGMYTLQALWTMARENLDVTVVVCANRAYRILQMELHRTGHDDPGPQARSLTHLNDPAPDWVALATGFGVDATRATTVDGLRDALVAGLASGGPSLIEAVL